MTQQFKNKLIGSLPVSDFIGASTAGKILNKSRQALHKHRLIRRGFIYSIRYESGILYHKKSVLDFKDTDDAENYCRYRSNAQSKKR